MISDLPSNQSTSSHFTRASQFEMARLPSAGADPRFLFLGGVWLVRVMGLALAAAATIALLFLVRTPEPTKPKRAAAAHVVYVHIDYAPVCYDGKVHPEGCPF